MDDIGTQVNVPGTRGKAILRYQGSIHGKNGIFAGLELLGSIALTRGKNCGDVEGFKYFEVQQPMTGLFLPFERLKAVNPQLEFTRDMISEVGSEFHNDTLDDEIVIEQAYSPIPQRVSQMRLTSLSPTIMAKRSQDRSRASSVGSFTRSPVLSYRTTSSTLDQKYGNRRSSGNGYLEQELYELRSKYERSEREMSDKLSILKDLKLTVEELQPILKQYESELDEKDRKINKIKLEFEAAREDWRQNLDIMVNTYEANENFYESKIKELQVIISEKNNLSTEQYVELEAKYAKLLAEKAEMEVSYSHQIKDFDSKVTPSNDISKELNRKILEQQKEIELLSNQLVDIRKFPAEGSGESYDKIIKLEADVENLSHLQAKSQQLEAENSELKREIERTISFEKLEDKNSELNKLRDVVRELKEQLASKEKEITELENSLDAKVKELTSKDMEEPSDKVKELEEDIFFKDQEIKALLQQLSKLSSNLSTQKERITELEAGKGKVDLVKQLESKMEEKDKTIKELEDKIQDSIVKEIDNMNLNDAAAMSELIYMEEIEKLRTEVAARPTIEELTELQDNIDEMVRLHNNEIFFKQEEMQRLQNENGKLQARLERVLESANINRRVSDTNSHDGVSIHSDLPVYKPETETDPSVGKDNWCGLCERDGHTSLNCPYENDIF